MGCILRITAFIMLAGLPLVAQAQTTSAANEKKPVEVTADDSLEWYQEKNLYVARGNAKAVRGDMTVEADTLSAHERSKDNKGAGGVAGEKKSSMGNIDKMTAEGNVRITGTHQRVTGDRAIYDIDQHLIMVTGQNLRYETDKEVVTAKDSLEYWDDRKIAVARGNAVADKGDRHVEAEVLTAEFRDLPNGGQDLYKMTATGGVKVVSKADVAYGDRAVYNIAGDVAVLTGRVRVTRADGTQLSGDVAEVDFKSGHSRLMNKGKGRVRVLLGDRSSSKAGAQ
ncbi:MAG: LptA/OstA family protein [Alphaproteobacteria bacterium]